MLAPVRNLGLLVIDGYVDLDPGGRPGLDAHAHAVFGVPVIGVAKSRFRTASNAAEVLRVNSARPLLITAARMPLSEAADLVRRMTGPFRLPDVPRRVDTLARTGQRVPALPSAIADHVCPAEKFPAGLVPQTGRADGHGPGDVSPS